MTACENIVKSLTHGIIVDYFPLEGGKRKLCKTLNYLHESKFSSINFFEIEDKPFEKIVFQELENSKIKHTVTTTDVFVY